MEFVSENLQVLVTLAVIIGTAVIAGICDALKTNNELLREQLLEYRLRQEQEEEPLRLASAARQETAQSAGSKHSKQKADTATDAAPRKPVGSVKRTDQSEGRALKVSNGGSLPVHPEEPAASPEKRPSRASRLQNGLSGRAERRSPSAEALAVMQQGLRLAGVDSEAKIVETGSNMGAATATASRNASTPPVNPPATPLANPAPTTATSRVSPEPKTQPKTETVRPLAESAPQVATPTMESKAEATIAPPAGGKAISRKKSIAASGVLSHTLVPQVWETGELEQASPSAEPGLDTNDATTMEDLPVGFQDGFVLTQLVKANKPVSGLVVSIGVNRTANGGKSHGSSNGPSLDSVTPDTVKDMILTLLGPQDFAAQAADDEYLLILPKEHGASAQRRLSEIAQKLWDFQIRSLGSYSILFSWGGVEVKCEAIDEAIASANERMQQTKHNRSVMSPAEAAAQQLRQAG